MPSREELIKRWRDVEDQTVWLVGTFGPAVVARNASFGADVVEREMLTRGLADAYGRELNRVVGGTDAKTVGQRYFLVAHASPQQRALAAYIVLESHHVNQ